MKRSIYFEIVLKMLIQIHVGTFKLFFSRYFEKVCKKVTYARLSASPSVSTSSLGFPVFFFQYIGIF